MCSKASAVRVPGACINQQLAQPPQIRHVKLTPSIDVDVSRRMATRPAAPGDVRRDVRGSAGLGLSHLCVTVRNGTQRSLTAANGTQQCGCVYWHAVVRNAV